MIKKVIILLSVGFAIIIGAGKISANATTVKVEVVSRNIENHTVNVKTDDHNADRFTLKEVSTSQMDVANKGSIVKVTYDDKFNLSAIEKVKSKDSSKSKVDIMVIFTFLMGFGFVLLFCTLLANM